MSTLLPVFFKDWSKSFVLISLSFSDGYVVKKYDTPYLEIICIFKLVFPSRGSSNLFTERRQTIKTQDI